MMFFPAQVFAHVKHTKNMSEKLFFAKNKVCAQFFKAKNMSKKMSSHQSRFSLRFSGEKDEQPSLQFYIQPKKKTKPTEKKEKKSQKTTKQLTQS